MHLLIKRPWVSGASFKRMSGVGQGSSVPYSAGLMEIPEHGTTHFPFSLSSEFTVVLQITALHPSDNLADGGPCEGHSSPMKWKTCTRDSFLFLQELVCFLCCWQNEWVPVHSLMLRPGLHVSCKSLTTEDVHSVDYQGSAGDENLQLSWFQKLTATCWTYHSCSQRGGRHVWGL